MLSRTPLGGLFWAVHPVRLPVLGKNTTAVTGMTWAAVHSGLSDDRVED